jgi:hypothetical protein
MERLQHADFGQVGDDNGNSSSPRNMKSPNETPVLL